MSNLSQFNNFTSKLPLQDTLMPVLFIGHGSPMNGIEDNEFSNKWVEIDNREDYERAQQLFKGN